MKVRTELLVLVVGLALLPLGLQAQSRVPARVPFGVGGGVGPEVKNPDNPKAFQGFAVAPSSIIRFMLSDQGKRILQRSTHPRNKDFLRAFGEDPGEPADYSFPEKEGLPVPLGKPVTPMPRPGPMSPGTVNASCSGAGDGVRFNLEPRANPLPQNGESTDFMLNRVSAGVDLIVQGANDARGFNKSSATWDGSITGYYVHTSGTDCSVQFEGGLPLVTDPLGGPKIFGGGDPVVAADPARDAFFMADLRFSFNTTGIGVFRTTGSTLLDPTKCPAVLTHAEPQAESCWPKGIVVNPLRFPFDHIVLQDKPHLAADERTSGVGAGNVYVTGTEFNFFNFFGSRTWLVSCTNDLSACSAPVYVSNVDADTHFSHVSVRPDGVITITYINVLGVFGKPGGEFDIKYVNCNPLPAPSTIVCAPATLVHHEINPLPFIGLQRMAGQDFPVATYPKHDSRAVNGMETYVVWDRCAVALDPVSLTCPQAEVVYKATRDNGANWFFSPASGPSVNISIGNKFFPWIKVDRSTNVVNIAYYTSQSNFFNHFVQVLVSHVLSGSATPEAINDIHPITIFLSDPNDDLLTHGFFFGDYIGLAARGTGTAGQSRAYTGYTYNTIQGTYNGIAVNEQNNHIARLDY